MSSEKPVSKKSLLVIKGQRITRADYRVILALTLVLSFVYVVIRGANCEAVAALGPLTGSAVAYYFHSKISDSSVN